MNPVSDRFADEIVAIFDPEAWSRGEIARQAYPTPRAVFNEYMTFAVFLLWARERYEPELFERGQAATIRQMEELRGFFRFGEFSRAVYAAYDSRPESATVESIYPQVLAWVREQPPTFP